MLQCNTDNNILMLATFCSRQMADHPQCGIMIKLIPQRLRMWLDGTCLSDSGIRPTIGILAATQIMIVVELFLLMRQHSDEEHKSSCLGENEILRTNSHASQAFSSKTARPTDTTRTLFWIFVSPHNHAQHSAEIRWSSACMAPCLIHCKLRPPESPIDHNKREESIAVADSSNMSITSKPIPIPQQQREDNHSHSNDNNELSSREAIEIYDAATWRMFDLITSARLRAAANANNYYLVDDRHTTAYTDDHHGAAVAAVGKSSQQQHPEGTRDRVYSLPEPPSSSSAPPSHKRSSLMEEMFPMDSL